jgi:hypothetical protein
VWWPPAWALGAVLCFGQNFRKCHPLTEVSSTTRGRQFWKFGQRQEHWPPTMPLVLQWWPPPPRQHAQHCVDGWMCGCLDGCVGAWMVCGVELIQWFDSCMDKRVKYGVRHYWWCADTEHPFMLQRSRSSSCSMRRNAGDSSTEAWCLVTVA